MKQNCSSAVELANLRKLKLRWILSLAIQPWIIFFPLIMLSVFGVLLRFNLVSTADSSMIESAFVHLQPVLMKQALIIEVISVLSIPYFTLRVIFDYVKDRRLSLLSTLIVSTSTFVILFIVQFLNLFWQN